MRFLTLIQNTRKLGWLLAAMWVATPIIITTEILLTFVFKETGWTHSIFTILISGPYILLTTLFCSKLVRSHFTPTRQSASGLFFTSILTLPILYFVYQNIIPRHLAQDVNDSPFDQIWYSVAQTTYGYPRPFLRFFDHPLEDYGSVLFDTPSLVFNFLILSFALYILALLTHSCLTLIRKRKPRPSVKA